MKVFLVKTSVGEWEDTVERTDSIWTKQEDAEKRVEILKRDNHLREQQKDLCWKCPCNKDFPKEKSVDEILKDCQEYCKRFCCSKGKPYEDKEYHEIECDESSINYESVTVYSPEACDLDNTELLKDGSIGSD